jgi:HSP20 family molecular chaperone IbpA
MTNKDLIQGILEGYKSNDFTWWWKDDNMSYQMKDDTFEVDVPGYSKEDLGKDLIVEVNGKNIIVRGKKKKREFSYQFYVNGPIQALNGEIKNGVLYVTLEKKLDSIPINIR